MKSRPKWPEHFEISEEEARWYWNTNIIAIELGMKWFSEDSASNCIDMYSKDENGKWILVKEQVLTLPKGVSIEYRYGMSLIQLDREIRDVLWDQHNWDEYHKDAVEKFEKLKKELYGE